MRILVISRSAWRNDNNTGNTLTDFFSDMPDVEIYSICMREQSPQNSIAKRHFYISERQMIKRLLGRTSIVVAEHTSEIEDDGSEKEMYDVAKRHPSYLLFFAREALWSLGYWKNGQMREYVHDIDPDVIFFPSFGCYYPHKVLHYLRMFTDARTVLFHADDHYTLKQFSISPLYWLYRFGLRKWMRRTVSIADLQYCISDIQKKDYEKVFGCECKILTKFADFNKVPTMKNKFSNPLQLIFTGNINIGRWKSLAILVQVLDRINSDGVKMQLRIYTATPLTKEMKNALSKDSVSFLMGSVPASEIPRIQQEADILVHVEAMDLKNRLAVRQSFSTKIVDYMKAARPILAVGPKNVASIDHLICNNCAIVANNIEELEQKLRGIFDNPSTLNKIAINAYECGRRNHNKQNVQQMLLQDLKALCE